MRQDDSETGELGRSQLNKAANERPAAPQPHLVTAPDAIAERGKLQSCKQVKSCAENYRWLVCCDTEGATKHQTREEQAIVVVKRCREQERACVEPCQHTGMRDADWCC